MTDTRPKAMEKAKQRVAEHSTRQVGATQTAKLPGTGFESEVEKAKQALRDDVNMSTGQNVQKLSAIEEKALLDRILRVAAYCRVSTDDIDQVISIELQKNNYRDMIKANPKWKYAGIYVDEGFSGTNTEHRPAFRLMMRDAMADKIDYNNRNSTNMSSRRNANSTVYWSDSITLNVVAGTFVLENSISVSFANSSNLTALRGKYFATSALPATLYYANADASYGGVNNSSTRVYSTYIIGERYYNNVSYTPASYSGTHIGSVNSADPAAYPAAGLQGGYYYVSLDT